MSGRVPPSSGAGRKRAASFARGRDARRAALLYERFTGHDGVDRITADVPDLPKSAAVIGELDAVQYTTVRDGRTEHYEHRFRGGDKPLLCVSPNGQQLLILGGAYVFTERGIVDASDSKNLPRRLRR